MLEEVKKSEDRTVAKKIDIANRSNSARLKVAEQWLVSKREAELLLQVAFDNKLDVEGREWKKKGIGILKSAYRVFTPGVIFQGTGLKPVIKSEYVSILEPEINRRIASAIVDAEPVANEDGIEGPDQDMTVGMRGVDVIRELNSSDDDSVL